MHFWQFAYPFYSARGLKLVKLAYILTPLVILHNIVMLTHFLVNHIENRGKYVQIARYPQNKKSRSLHHMKVMNQKLHKFLTLF